MNVFTEILSIIGFVVRALGFIVLGFGVGRFAMESYKHAVWQVQIALIFGFFGLLAVLTNYASAGSMGMFALSSGVAMILSNMPKKEETEEAKKE